MRVRARCLILCATLTLLGACDRALQIPLDGGTDATFREAVDGKTDGAVTGDACRDIEEGSRCEAQLGCYALRSGDLPCDNASCSDHFIECLPAPATCTKPQSDEKCHQIMPSCRTGTTLHYGDGICPDGCAALAKCKKPGG